MNWPNNGVGGVRENEVERSVFDDPPVSSTHLFIIFMDLSYLNIVV